MTGSKKINSSKVATLRNKVKAITRLYLIEKVKNANQAKGETDNSSNSSSNSTTVNISIVVNEAPKGFFRRMMSMFY